MVWFSASAGILTKTFRPLPEGEMNTEYTYLFLLRFSLSCNSSFCLTYPSKSKHISPLCSIRAVSALLLNVPLKQIAGSCFFSSFLSGFFFSKRIFFTSSFVAPSLILSRITLTSLKKGVLVSLMFWKIVILYVINVKVMSKICRLTI